MNEIYLLTGGNIGNRQQYLEKAFQLIQQTAGKVVGASSVYETAAWGFREQAAFLNQVLYIHSTLAPQDLLGEILQIERQLGRERLQKNGPRVIDIDILFYNDLVITTGDLIIPHPRIAERRFVLTPLVEIAPEFIHPVYKVSIRQMLLNCPDSLEVRLYQEN